MKNTPPLNNGGHAKSDVELKQDNLTRPTTTKAFEELSKVAYEYLIAQQEEVEKAYGIGNYENWYYDQTTGILTFSDKGEIKLEINYESVGSLSKVGGTWLWAWANPHLEDIIKTEINKVQEYGKQFNLDSLMKSKWYADQYDAWKMTAISAYLLQAKGAYRIPTDNTYFFVLFKEVKDRRIN